MNGKKQEATAVHCRYLRLREDAEITNFHDGT